MLLDAVDERLRRLGIGELSVTVMSNNSAIARPPPTTTLLLARVPDEHG